MHFLFVYLQINICRFAHVSCKPNKYSTCIRLVSNNKIVWFLSSIKRWEKKYSFFPISFRKNGANNRASRTHCYRYTCRSFAHKIQWKYLHFLFHIQFIFKDHVSMWAALQRYWRCEWAKYPQRMSYFSPTTQITVICLFVSMLTFVFFPSSLLAFSSNFFFLFLWKLKSD